MAPEYLTTACVLDGRLYNIIQTSMVLLSTLSGRPHLRSSDDNKHFVPRSLAASMGHRASARRALPGGTLFQLGYTALEQFKCLLKASLFA